jgi:hypothetical protein
MKLQQIQEPHFGRSWIVCWTIGVPAIIPGGFTTKYTDHWEANESYEEAKKLFDNLYGKDDVYIRSLCAVMDSSDYEPHPAFENIDLLNDHYWWDKKRLAVTEPTTGHRDTAKL